MLRAAVDDVQLRVALQQRATTRYVALYPLPESSWDEARAVVSFVVNSVSRSAQIVRPRVVPGSGGGLLRLDIERLAPDAAEARRWLNVWERMVADDPYFHLKTEALDPANGRRRVVLTDGGWVDLAMAARLRHWTGSRGAVVRADWFVAQATVPPLYYEFAGVPKRKADWLEQLGVDAVAIKRLGANRGANLFRSGVTDKPRRLSRWNSLLGAIWNTYDTAGGDATKDVFRNPTFTVRFDAGEHIATRANGLLEYALFDSKGIRQDAVPPEIAIDDTVSPPVPLVPMLSCVRCHGVGDEDGLRSFTDDQSRLLASGRVALLVDDRQRLTALELFYGRQARLQRELERDRDDYRHAVGAATGGMSPSDVARELAAMYETYVVGGVKPAQAARELGLSVAQFRRAMSGSVDPIVLALVEGLSVQRDQWEASFAEAALRAAAAEAEKDEHP